MKGKGTGTLPRSPVAGGSLSSGVADGLSESMKFESDQTVVDADFNQSSSAAPGFSRDVKGQEKSKSAKSKGLSFEIIGCGS